LREKSTRKMRKRLEARNGYWGKSKPENQVSKLYSLQLKATLGIRRVETGPTKRGEERDRRTKKENLRKAGNGAHYSRQSREGIP